MIIEHFKNRDAKPVYNRFMEKGRMLPEGLNYVTSWTETNFDRCFQIMECAKPILIEEWISEWDDLVDFEIVPVMTSSDAAKIMSPPLK